MQERERERLSEREIEVLQAVVDHGSVKEAAAALHLSRETVATHLRCMHRKTGFGKTHQLSAWAAELGTIRGPR